jgi:uncharacterized protein
MIGGLPCFNEPVGLFPLPNVVLLPGGTLPLQVFEPRYRAMVRDALEGQSIIAMALLRPGNLYETYHTNHADIHQVVCVGRIREHIQIADGRYFINLAGMCRARILEEDRDGEYRRALLDALLEPTSGIEQDGEYAARQSLQQLLTSPVFNDLDGVDRLRRMMSSPAPLGEVVDITAANLLPPKAIEIRQRLLEETDVLQRACTLLYELNNLRRTMELQQSARMDWPRFGSMN